MIEFPEIDNVLSGRIPEILQAQEEFRALHGRFLQLGKTHLLLPSVENPRKPDLAGEKIPSEPVAWDDLGELPGEMRSCLEVHNYEGPLGHGFVVIARTSKQGVRYVRALNFGPEGRSFGWREEVVE